MSVLNKTEPEEREAPDPVIAGRPLAASRRRGRRGPVEMLRGTTAWWSVPGILVTLGVLFLPTLAGAFYAFTNWSGIGGFDFVGLDNFAEIFTNAELLGSLTNTLMLALGFVILTNLIGLLLALALNRALKTRYILRTLLFMPVVLTPIAVSYVWGFIFAFDGPLNEFLGAVGLESWQTDWLAGPVTAKVAVLVVMVWQNSGIVMVMYLAGLATVPVELEEAAALDGAGRFNRFRHIVLPAIQPSVAIATTLMLVQGLRVFDQIMALTGGGPAGATHTLATQIYQQTFVFGKYGSGTALALLLSVLMLAFAIFQQYVTRDRSQGA